MCLQGATIGCREVVDFMKAPLIEERSAMRVLMYGGLLTIRHPIFNRHCMFVAPIEYPNNILMVNSWLGPLMVDHVSAPEIMRFVMPKCTSHWVLHESKYSALSEESASHPAIQRAITEED